MERCFRQLVRCREYSALGRLTGTMISRDLSVFVSLNSLDAEVIRDTPLPPHDLLSYTSTLPSTIIDHKLNSKVKQKRATSHSKPTYLPTHRPKRRQQPLRNVTSPKH